MASISALFTHTYPGAPVQQSPHSVQVNLSPSLYQGFFAKSLLSNQWIMLVLEYSMIIGEHINGKYLYIGQTFWANSVTACTVVSISSAVVNGPGLKRTVPPVISVPMAWCMRGAQ